MGRSHAALEKQLKIVSYEELKGVWGDRRYPILWFEPDWDKVGSTFLYDEHYNSDIVRRIQSKDRELGSLEDLTKVFKDHDRLPELEELWQDLLNGKLADEATTLGRAKELASHVEVHCVAVCFRDDGRVLVGRRPANKKRYAGMWEFGCGQLSEGETFAECLRRNYKADFGIDIEFQGTPRPIQSYEITDSDARRSIPGIVFIASVLNQQDAKPNKHSEIDWINPKELPADIDNTYVPAARERLQLALQARNQFETKS